MAALDDQIRETVNRLLESLRSRLETDVASCQDELVRAAQEASNQAELQLGDLRRRLDEAHQDAERRVGEGQSRIDESQQEIADLKNDLEAARKQLDETRDDVEATLSDIETSRLEVEASRLEIETARRDFDTARLEVSRLTEALRNKEEQAVQAARLPDAVRALDEAATFGEVLETLAVRAGREAGRAAVFLVKEKRLRDWRTVGFDLASEAPRLDIELGDSGLMAEAVRSAEGVYPRDDSQVPEFARTAAARRAAAWPVSVGGFVVAVLYADSPVADTSNEPYWPAFLDVLARHAGRVLEGITVRQAAGLMTGKAAGLSSPSIGHQSSGSIQ